MIAKKSISRGTAMVAVAGSTLIALTAPTHAGNSKLCADEQVCIYTDNNFVGLIDIPRPAHQGVRNVGARDNDKMDSWENKTDTNAAWYHDANGGGDCVTMVGQREDSNINVFDSDELSSWRTDRGC